MSDATGAARKSGISTPQSRRPRPGTQPQETRLDVIAGTTLQTTQEADRPGLMHAIIKAYAAGVEIAQLAEQLRCSDVQLYMCLLRHTQDDWREVQEARTLAKMARAEDNLASAQDGLSLGKCREQLHHAQWEAERLLARIYAIKQDSAPPVAIQINLGLSQSAEVGPKTAESRSGSDD